MLKRFLIHLTACTALASSGDVFAATEVEPQSPLRVMSVDWSQTETMIALGITPVASAQQSDYNDWVRSPKIPQQTLDVGLRNQPNVERMSELNLDKIFLSPRFASLEGQLSRIAPVKILGLYKVGEVDWQAVKDFTRRMAKEVNAESQAEQLISNSESTLQQLKSRLVEDTPAVILVQFMDAKHVRVFGDNSIYQVALQQLEVANAWNQQTNAWGFTLVGIDQLQGLDGQIIVIDPLPAGVKEHLSIDQYWRYLVEQTGYPTLSIEPTWSFGGMPSAVRFATLVTDALTKEGM